MLLCCQDCHVCVLETLLQLANIEGDHVTLSCDTAMTDSLIVNLNPVFVCHSYAIDRDSNPERQFSINGMGLVTTVKPLDREAQPTHRLHILAIDRGEYTDMVSVILWPGKLYMVKISLKHLP